MSNKERLQERIKEVEERLSAMQPGSDNYAKVLEDLQSLYKVLETESEMENKVRKLELDETKVKMDFQLSESEIDQKNRDSKRGFWKTIAVVGITGLVSVIVAACEETRIIPRNAWGLVSNLFRSNRI